MEFSITLKAAVNSDAPLELELLLHPENKKTKPSPKTPEKNNLSDILTPFGLKEKTIN